MADRNLSRVQREVMLAINAATPAAPGGWVPVGVLAEREGGGFDRAMEPLAKANERTIKTLVARGSIERRDFMRGAGGVCGSRVRLTTKGREEIGEPGEADDYSAQALLLEWTAAAAKAIDDECARAPRDKLANGLLLITGMGWGGELRGLRIALESGLFSSEGLRRVAWYVEYNLRAVFLSQAQKDADWAREREENRLLQARDGGHT